MTEKTRHFTTDLTIIGSGIAGFAASIFALNSGIETAQVGNTGAVAYTTGYLDLLGKLENEDGFGDSLSDPWEGLDTLRKNHPDHPLSMMSSEDTREAFTQFTTFISENGIGYTSPGEENITALTPVGTLKKTLCVPQTMTAGPVAFQKKQPCVIVDFKGLKGFSARQVVSNLKDQWPALSSAKISFPDMDSGEIYPEVMARALEVEKTREELAEKLKEAAGDVQLIGMPAVLGMHNPDSVHRELERLTGLTIFEIPTMPPSVPGIRLRELFEQLFPAKGVTLIPQQKVRSIAFEGDGVKLCLADNYGPIEIESKTVILATGRFLSGGLEAQITGIKEPLLDLPVKQPEQRDDWYLEKYAGKAGHAIHQAGIEVDSSFRPLDSNGQIYNERLFAVGIVLANQDWIRGRSGAGIAIATAYKAVHAIENFLHR